MTTAAGFVEARKAFHASLLQSTLTINSAGVVSNADSSNTTSKAIAKGIADLLKAETIGERIAGQTSARLAQNAPGPPSASMEWGCGTRPRRVTSWACRA